MLRLHQSTDSDHRSASPFPTPLTGSHLSLASWVTEEQLTAVAAEHGHGVTQIEHVRQHYTIASAHCAQRVSLPSAELELMIHVSPRPRMFGGEPSADLKNSCGSASTGADLRPQAHLCHRPPWPSARCGESHVGTAIINATTVI